MLDDIGPYSAVVLLLVLYGALFIQVLLSSVLTIVLEKFVERKTGKKKGFWFFLLSFAAIFIIIKLVWLIPHLVETYQKNNFRIPSSNPHLKLDSIVKEFQDQDINISFDLMVDQSGNYLFMPALPPCYKLNTFNGQLVKDTLPIIYLTGAKTTGIKISFLRMCGEKPNYFEIDVSPKSANVSFDGWKRIAFTGDDKDLKNRAWASHYNHEVMYIYVNDFNLN